MEPAVDPVCGMSVDPARAEARHDHGGKTFHFCCSGCRDRFAAAPEQYTGLRARTPAWPVAHPMAHPASPPAARQEEPAAGARAAAGRTPPRASRWTCPMHPEVVSDRPGPCPKCGMALEPMDEPFGPPQSGPAAEPEELTDMRRRLIEAAILTAPLLVVSMGSMLPGAEALAFGHLGPWIQLILATPVVWHAGWPLLARGAASVRTGHLNMFTLIALGVLSAWGASLLALLFPGSLPAGALDAHGRPPLYFESAAVITVLVLVGQVIELRSRDRARAAIRALAALLPRTALRRAPDGSLEEIALDAVRPGDALVVRPGTRLPADGTILEGSSAVDESLLTGESLPVTRAAGDPVVAGTLNGHGALTIAATRVGEDSFIAGIARQITEAQRTRAPIQRLADRVSAWFVPAVIVVATIAFAAWATIGPEPRLAHALVAAVAVLIIACPCALGLATPMSILVAAGRGATAGVLIRDAAAIEHLARADSLVIDKTGTLTEGRPRVTAVETTAWWREGLPSGPRPAAEAAADLLGLAAAVERLSEHPIAGAVVAEAAARGLPARSAVEFVSEAGGGARARVDGRQVAIGTPRFAFGAAGPPEELRAAAASPEASGRTVVWIAVDERPAGLIAVADPLRPYAADTIAALSRDGLEVVLASGDAADVARAVARQVGIATVEAPIDPAGKGTLVRRLRAAGRTVAMAGDGVNDAPALAEADSGIAMASGTDVAIGAAGIVLVRGDIAALVRARRLSRGTLRNIRQNLALAFGYNVACIPLAAGVFYPWLGWTLNPMVAAAAMSLSSVTVIANAVRLRRLPL